MNPEKRRRLAIAFPELSPYFQGGNPDLTTNKKPSDEELLELIRPLIDELVTNIKNGEDYVLTEEDKTSIASEAALLIDVPIVEKVVEKVVIKETPIVTEIKNEVLPKDLASKINTLTQAIDVSVIKGAVHEKDLAIRDKKVSDGMEVIQGRIKLIDQRWRGGGLTKVYHDTTLSGDGTAANPLSSTGGGFSEIAISGTIDDSNTSFTAATAPTYLVINGMWYKKSGGAITWTGTTSLTLSSPIGLGSTIWGF